jgi:hypothetical protein
VIASSLLLWLACCLFSSRLPGGGITFFAAAKKVIKESSFYKQARWLDGVACFNFTVAALGRSPQNFVDWQPCDNPPLHAKTKWSAVILSAMRYARREGRYGNPQHAGAQLRHTSAHDRYSALRSLGLPCNARTTRRTDAGARLIGRIATMRSART